LFTFTDINDQFETKKTKSTNLVQMLNLKTPKCIWPSYYCGKVQPYCQGVACNIKL